MRPFLLPLLATALASAFLCGALAAQQNVVWLNTQTTGTGGGNAFPWGSNGIRYQTIVPGIRLPPAFVLNDIFVVGAASGTDIDIDYTDIEILIGATSVVAPTTTWAVNNPNPVRVYRGPLRVYLEVGAWRGLGLPSPAVFVATPTEPNLCIEIIVWGTTNGTGNFYFSETDSSVNRAFRYQWTTNQTQAPVTGAGGAKLGLLLGDGNFVEVGTGCPGVGGVPRMGASTWPQPGQPLNLTLSSGAPNAPTFLALGTNNLTLGAIPLPVDLGLLGAPGCKIWNDPLIVLATVTNTIGAASITLPIPFFGGYTRMYGMWLNLDSTANTFGMTTSSGGKLLLGN